jgi:hypothetical protein
MDDNKISSYFKEFDQLGESFVRSMIASDGWASYDKSKHGAAVEWVRRKDEERDLASSSRRDSREEQTLEIAQEANRIASSALTEARLANRSRRWDRTWTIIAIMIAAIAAREDIMWLILWFLHNIIGIP